MKNRIKTYAKSLILLIIIYTCGVFISLDFSWICLFDSAQIRFLLIIYLFFTEAFHQMIKMFEIYD